MMKNSYTLYMIDGSVHTVQGFSEIDAFMTLGYDECEFSMVDKCLPGNSLRDYAYDDDSGKWIPVTWHKGFHKKFPNMETKRNPHITAILDAQAKAIWGRGLTESVNNKICVSCGSSLDDMPPTYELDGFCQNCVDSFNTYDPE